MKKLLLFALPALLLAFTLPSCQKKDYVIQSVQVDSGAWVRTYDAAGNQLPFNHRLADTSYTVAPSFAEKVHMARQRGDLLWFFLGIGMLIAGIVYFIKRTAGGDDKVVYVIMLGILILGCGGLIGGSVDWVHTREETIKKPVYDSLIKADGDLRGFWKTVQP